jgi:hypothetical protein
MSGRSAYVRKEKTKVKDGITILHEDGLQKLDKAPSLIGEFPVPMSDGRPMQFKQEFPYRHHHSDRSTIKSHASSGSDDLAYARVRKPQMPIIDASGIERSSFRSMMDKKSENVRKGLTKAFGKKKKGDDENDQRPPTAATVRPESHELDAGYFDSAPPPILRNRQQQYAVPQDYIRLGPPQGKLPPIPQAAQLKRWPGSGRPPQAWNKLRKDPELWDTNGDTLIYFGHETNQNSRPLPSFRISSHVIESTDSRFLITLLREGAIDDDNGFGMPPSPISSPGSRPIRTVQHGRHQPTPPVSEGSQSGYEGQISYEIYFPAPLNLSKNDTIQHQATTRNVFALLYNASVVGLDLFQALTDLHDRLEVYMPPEVETRDMILEWIVDKALDDVRSSPSTAAALLAWSETVEWVDGWREAYVHAVGMFSKVEICKEFRFITPITRALLERASLELSVRIQNAEDKLDDFDFADMWPLMDPRQQVPRAAFERARNFFQQYYQSAFGGRWPPAPANGEEQWLTRSLVKQLQKDFGALYDYLVNRKIVWDGTEERSGRKWNIIQLGNKSFNADTSDLPFTDLLVSFDNRHKYVHIPHPYPLVPESVPPKKSSKDNLFKSNKKSNNTPAGDKMAERRAALAYTESTNIYLLGSGFVRNDLVDAFVRFEKSDRAGDVDPYAARRGRWVMIYGILQVLASISVDTPHLRYTADVPYHLNPKLRGTPPWKGPNSQDAEEASHTGSHCWTVQGTWNTDSPVDVKRRGPPLTMNTRTSGAPSVSGTSESDTASSYRSPTYVKRGRNVNSNEIRQMTLRESEMTSFSGYAPGIEKMEWPIREESRGSRNPSRTGSRSRAGSLNQRQRASGEKEYMQKEMSPREMHQRDMSSREPSLRDQLSPKDFVIKDFDGYNFKEGAGSLGSEWVKGRD